MISGSCFLDVTGVKTRRAGRLPYCALPCHFLVLSWKAKTFHGGHTAGPALHVATKHLTCHSSLPADRRTMADSGKEEKQGGGQEAQGAVGGEGM